MYVGHWVGLLSSRSKSEHLLEQSIRRLCKELYRARMIIDALFEYAPCVPVLLKVGALLADEYHPVHVLCVHINEQDIN